MRILELVSLIAVAGVLAGLSSCASSSAPSGFLGDAESEQTDTFGGWIEVDLEERTRGAIDGELIAVQRDTVFVLVGQSTRPRLVGVSTAEIRDLKLRGYDPKSSRYATWAVLGTLTTPSHGMFLAVSLPLWIIVGTASAAVQSQSADYRVPEVSLAELRVHARFPSGIPEGLDRSSLTVKPRR
jgi:hypothetical protein